MEKIKSPDTTALNPIGLKDVDICIMKHFGKYFLRISWVGEKVEGSNFQEGTNTVSNFLPMTKTEANVLALRLGIDIIGDDKPKWKQTELV